jgi:hypothetical protein
VNGQDLNLDRLSAGLGHPTALYRTAGEIAAFNMHLAAEGKHRTRGELLDIQTALNTLALAIARVERMVTERIAALTAGARNGN